MQTRKLGYTDLHLTTIGFGSWAAGGGDWKFGWGPQDDQASIAAIRRSTELGVNWIDTAAVYGLGHSEDIVGAALKELKTRPIIATKCSRVTLPNRDIGSSLKRESVRAECDASLRRLSVERIDLYQIHWPLPPEDIEEGWGAVAELVREGKVRYAGVCNFNLDQLKRIQPIHPVASLQPPYSMLARGIEEVLPFCAQNNIGVVVYSPMQKGLLSGKMTRERIATFHPTDHRRNDPRFGEPQITRTLNIVEALRPIAQRHGKTVAQLAIAWTLWRPEVTSAIVGARNARQIEETAPAADWNLDAAAVAEIEKILAIQ